MNADGTGLVKLTTNVQLSADGAGPVFSWDLTPAWSPDGTQIAFASTRDGLADTELYVMNADGSNQTRLTDNINDDRNPSWSPDSQRIVFDLNGSSFFGINIFNRDGSNLTNVTHDGGAAKWSPDGMRLTYIRSDPAIQFKGAVFVINIDGTNPIQVTHNNFGARAPSWAPASSAPIPTFTISGQIKDGNGAPISGASLNLLGTFPLGTFTRSTQSDASGAYSFSGLAAGNYRIDILKSGFGFVPPSITFNNLTTNQTADFTAFVAFSISGQLTGLNGNGILVTLTGSQSRTVLCDSSGHYSFDLLPAGGNYTVSINTPFFVVSPGSATFNNLSANQTANFDLVIAKYTIRGTITRLGVPKAGITVELADTSGFAPLPTITDANGQYSFTNVSAGRQLTVRPVNALYLMQPQTYDYAALDSDKTADFVALSVNRVGFSNATVNVVEGTPSLQLTVFRGGNASGVGPITVDYATTDGTAKAGFDYTAVSGTLEFPEGSFSRTITIPLLDDQVHEGSEQFSVILSNPTGEVDLGTPSSAVVTILDNEPHLITEADSDRAIAFNAVTFVTEPFSRTTEHNLGTDTRTRLALFVEDIGTGFPPITVDAMDVQQNHYQLPLEAIARFTSFPFTQLVVRLPENLPAGEMFITITVNGQVSNMARISIKQ